MVRAQMFEAAACAQEDVIMIATDAIYSTRPLPQLELGPGLGQWKMKTLPDFFVVQSGFYWSPGKLAEMLKSRGIKRSVVSKYAPEFEAVWISFVRDLPQECEIYVSSAPVVPIDIEIFIGLKLALELRTRLRLSQFARGADCRDGRKSGTQNCASGMQRSCCHGCAKARLGRPTFAAPSDAALNIPSRSNTVGRSRTLGCLKNWPRW
jgi:hypothetical protein